MRKRSKYRPRDRLLDPVGYVVENSKGLAEQHQEYLTTLKIKTHAAMLAITQGQATKKDMDYIVQTFNIMQAFKMLGIGGIENEIETAKKAIYDICLRTPKLGKFIATGPEITALNTLIDYHDELFEHITVKQLDDAVKLARKIIRSGRADPLPEVKL